MPQVNSNLNIKTGRLRIVRLIRVIEGVTILSECDNAKLKESKSVEKLEDILLLSWWNVELTNIVLSIEEILQNDLEGRLSYVIGKFKSN